MPGVWGRYALYAILPREEFMGKPETQAKPDRAAFGGPLASRELWVERIWF